MQSFLRKRGFTIIEVVLVLAIAGLIFLAVFIAFPNLQKAQRNTQRKEEASKIFSAIQQYHTNNNKMPFTMGDKDNADRLDKNFFKNYLDSECTIEPDHTSQYGDDHYQLQNCKDFVDPTGQQYKVTVLVGNSGGFNYDVSELQGGEIVLGAGTACGNTFGTDTNRKANGSKDSFLVMIALEGQQYYCIDNE